MVSHRVRSPFLSLLTLAACLALAAPAAAQEDQQQQQAAPVKKDVPYVPTPQEVVDEMLKIAQVKEGDTVYDLGCGDGRIIVTAAKQHGANGIGVDIDPQRIAESNENAKQAGVTDKVKFIEQDLFTMEFKDADVLAMYLLPSVNVKLRPKILSDMKPGSRIVSHSFDMGDWKPDRTETVEHSTIHYWVVPAKVDGKWTAKIKDGKGEQQAELNLQQQYQEVTGTAKVGDKQQEIRDAKLEGSKLTFTLADAGDQQGGQKYTCEIKEDGSITGTAEAQGGGEAAQLAGHKS